MWFSQETHSRERYGGQSFPPGPSFADGLIEGLTCAILFKAGLFLANRVIKFADRRSVADPPAQCVQQRHPEDVSVRVLHVASSSKTLQSLDLALIVQLLPRDAQVALTSDLCLQRLVEVVMDFGRPAVARFPSGDKFLTKRQISIQEVEEAIQKVGDFGGDNRAGIDGTLHRISCVRNRTGKIIGLTCRVGRDIPSSSQLAQDIARDGKSILLLGAPGVGKTTAIRSICRLLSEEEKKRVVIVDTSNEIAGDGDVPHKSIGSSRRLQVKDPSNQHSVMIEAVENHTPDVLVIDEIGISEECDAARTISRRGIKLIATAHGKKLADLVEDPILSNLLGGSQAVTLGDRTIAKHVTESTGTTESRPKKTVMERKGAPSFDVVVELRQRNEWIVYHDVTRATDDLLRGESTLCEQRSLDGGDVVKKTCLCSREGTISEVFIHSTPSEAIDASQSVDSQLHVQSRPSEANNASQSVDSQFPAQRPPSEANNSTQSDVEIVGEDLHPDLVKGILNAKTVEEALKVTKDYTKATLLDNFNNINKMLHPTFCKSSDAKAARRIALQAYLKLKKNRK